MTRGADLRLHLAILLLVAAGYLVIRIGIAPTGGFLRHHATDLLAGVALPSVLALTMPAGAPMGDWVRSIGGKLQVTLGAALVWEGLMPLLTANATADPVDALCYFTGATAQHLVARQRRRHLPSPRP